MCSFVNPRRDEFPVSPPELPGTRASGGSARSFLAVRQAGGVAMHDDELSIEATTVRALVDEQFPQWAGLPLERVGRSGTVHAIFRIGDELSARFPLRPADPAAVRASFRDEADAARELGEHVTIAVPAPMAIAEPGHGYPLPWAVHRWMPGETADVAAPADPNELAADLADLVGRVRRIPVRGRSFRGTGRGGDLRDHDPWMRACLARSAQLLPVDRLRAMWARLRSTPRHDADAMTHGDLVPGNIVLQDGRLSGVLDLASYGAADPALDLVVAWHLLDDEPRATFRDRLGCDDVHWQRGMAWAFEQAMGLVWYYESTNPTMSDLGRRTLDRLLDA